MVSWTSRNVRVLVGGGFAAVRDFLDEEEGSSWSFLVFWVREGRVLSRSCWISLRERERPVPSYPLIVDAMKTR